MLRTLVNHNVFPINSTKTMKKVQFFAKFFSNSGPLLWIWWWSQVVFIACFPQYTRNSCSSNTEYKNDCDCWESPVARYLRVTINLSASEMTFLDRHGFLAISGPTRVRRCSNLSGDILVYLWIENKFSNKCSRDHFVKTKFR